MTKPREAEPVFDRIRRRLDTAMVEAVIDHTLVYVTSRSAPRLPRRCCGLRMANENEHGGSLLPI
jgi:hypothetical protein